MAVTILSQPATHTPGYNDQYFVATSTNSNQTNFKYVVAVTIDTDTITQKFDKRPDNGLLYFDPARIVQSYLYNTFSRASLDFLPADDSIMYVTVGVTEEYGSPVSGFTGASGSYYVWNAAYNTHDFASYSYATTTSAKDLTTAPSLTETIDYDQKFLQKIWHRGFGTRDLRYLTITSTNSSGAVIQIAVIENAYYNIGSYKRNLIELNCSPYGLNNFAGTVISKTDALQDIVPATTSYYTMVFTNTTGDTSSSTYTVNIDTMCYKYDRYVLHFLNRLGNYDSFTFNFLSRKTSEKKTLEYKKNPYENVSNNLIYYNDSSDIKNYNTTITNKITLNSDYITDAEATWLKDMFNSPSVILEDSNNAIYAVKITDVNYEEKLKVNDSVFQITVNCEYSYQDIRQRG